MSRAEAASRLRYVPEQPVQRPRDTDWGCSIGIVDDRPGFDALEAEWKALFERAGRPEQLFQSFELLWHWSNRFLDGSKRLAIVTGWSGTRLVMVWPLVLCRGFGVEALRWMGEPVAQYGDALVEPGPQARLRLLAGWASVRSLGADVAVLRKVRSTANVAEILADIGHPTAASFAPYLDFGPARSFEDVQKRFPAKLRSDRRRLMRRLAERGQITMPDSLATEAAPALVARAFAIKRQALDRRGRLAPALDDPAMEGYFVDALTATDRPTGAVCDVVACDGTPIAIALSFCCKGEAFGHILAHDVAFNKQGAGVVLAEQVFRAALVRGLSRFDMLAPDDAFKSTWASGKIGVEDWAVPLTWRGRLFVRLWLGGLRAAVKSWSEAAPPWFGRAVARGRTFFRH